MDTITIDADLAKKLELGMKSGEAIELPFPVVYAWALSGQASYKSQGGAQYYGGWACKAGDMQALCEAVNINIPSGWTPATVVTKDGDEFEAYITRLAIVAPIAKRISWLYDGKRYPDYVEGGRRHLQVLAYLTEQLGEKGSYTYEPWGPVVLTAKGHQARFVLESFSKWEKATAQIRSKIARGVPAWCFYLALGTFGKERLVTNVGKPGAQSPITPINAYIPEKLTEETVAGLFVGHEVARVMVDYQASAAEWLSAWKQAEAGQNGAAPVEDEFFTPPDAGVEDDVPF